MTLAVLSKARVSAASSFRLITPASASFSAKTTVFKISRISPGRMMSFKVTWVTLTPAAASSVTTAAIASASTAPFSAKTSSSVLVAKDRLKAEPKARCNVSTKSFTALTARTGSTTLNVADKLARMETRSFVKISWPVTSSAVSRVSTILTAITLPKDQIA